MAIEFRIESGVSDERWSGAVGTAEILAFLDQIFAHPGFEPGLRRLIHLGDTRVDVSFTEMQQIVERLRARAERLERQRCAVVAPRPAQFGLARMFEALADELPMEFHVFENETEARTWLATR